MTWSAFLDRISIRFPIPVEVRAGGPAGGPGGHGYGSSPDDVELRVTLTCPDLETGDPLRVHLTDYPPPIRLVEDPARYLRCLILRALAHELDETLLVDGAKAWDPHRSECWLERL